VRRTRLDLETLLLELLERGIDVESVPKDDDVYDQSERSELIFLSFMISLAEFAPLSVEDGSRQFMTIFAFVELLEYTTTFGFIVDVSERMNCLVDAAQFGNGLRQSCWTIANLQCSHDGGRLNHAELE
jgi:hypothetical protein